jgi:hypothetical protein
MRSTRGVLVALLTVASTGAAQISRGDSGFRPGTINQTESALYDAVRTRPRDPAARAALGRYLLSRGATRVGMTLLEEALKFGGDSAAIEPDLARAYLDAGEYKSLAALKSISAVERDRAIWLAAHESRTIASDSIFAAPLRAPADSASVGQIILRVNGHAIPAAISARVSGILISDTAAVASGLHRFGVDGGSVLGAADSVRIAGMSVSNVPLAIARIAGGHSAIVGLDFVGQYVPTFDARAGELTLHVGMTRVPLPSGARFVTWSTPTDLQVFQSGGWISITRPSMGRELRDHRWTFDARSGMLVIER